MNTGEQQSFRLNPTLWRTCRVLANRRRLRILGYLLRHPWQSVSGVSQGVGLCPSLSSQYLRALNARGLLEVRRVGRWVEYRVAANRTIRGTAPLIRALRERFRREDDPLDGIFRDLTAFTHPRRVRLISLLRANGAMRVRELCARGSMSYDALRRHLMKLEARSIVEKEGDAYRLSPRQAPLVRTLISMS